MRRDVGSARRAGGLEGLLIAPLIIGAHYTTWISLALAEDSTSAHLGQCTFWEARGEAMTELLRWVATGKDDETRKTQKKSLWGENLDRTG